MQINYLVYIILTFLFACLLLNEKETPDVEIGRKMSFTEAENKKTSDFFIGPIFGPLKKIGHTDFFMMTEKIRKQLETTETIGPGKKWGTCGRSENWPIEKWPNKKWPNKKWANRKWSNKNGQMYYDQLRNDWIRKLLIENWPNVESPNDKLPNEKWSVEKWLNVKLLNEKWPKMKWFNNNKWGNAK